MLLSAALLAAPALAGATYSSETQHVLLLDSANVFQETEVDSGWLPSGSPLQARFQIEGAGSSDVIMEGDADLFWPTDLNLYFTPELGTGELFVNASLDAVTSVKFDVFGYTWESEIDRRGIGVEGDVGFDPFVLADQLVDRVEIVDPDLEIELITYELEVFAGVELIFDAYLSSEMVVGFEGRGWRVDETQYPFSTDVLHFPAAGQALQEVVASFVGAWDAAFSLILTPALTVDAGILGEYEILSFDFPLTLASSAFEQDFPATRLSFPLPVLSTEYDSYDFGELEVGQLANLELPIYNDGLMDLQGVPGLTGSAWFSLYPDYFQAAPGFEDGLVVTFAPESEGEFTATLLLVSNDPTNPTREITLTGTGYVPEEPAEDTGAPESEGDQAGDAVIQSEVRGCGCASGGQRSGLALVGAVLVGLLALGRRRRD